MTLSAPRAFRLIQPPPALLPPRYARDTVRNKGFLVAVVQTTKLEIYQHADVGVDGPRKGLARGETRGDVLQATRFTGLRFNPLPG